jgi:hypothetical protein
MTAPANATKYVLHNAVGVSAANPVTPNPPGVSRQGPMNNGPPVNTYYEGLNWWGVCNNPLLKSDISQSCDILVTPDKNALTSKGKVVLEGILCPKGPSIVSTIQLFYGTIPQELKDDLATACGWR